jgi:hypothetical protein
MAIKEIHDKNKKLDQVIYNAFHLPLPTIRIDYKTRRTIKLSTQTISKL